MQRISTFTTLVFALVFAIGFLSCGGASKQEGNFTSQQASEQLADMEEVFSGFEVPENDPTRLYASTSADSRSMPLAVDKAKHAAQLDIAQQMQLRVRGVFRSFMEETGGGEDAQLLQEVTNTSESIVSESLIGCKMLNKKVFRDKNTGMYRAYALMEMPLDLMNAKMIQQIRSKEHLYTRFRASESFKEAEEKWREYEEQQKQKMEQTIP